MSILDRILNRNHKTPVPVPTPEWPELDGHLFARRLSPTERIAFDQAAAGQAVTSGAQFVAFTAVWCTVLSDGTRAFDDADWRALADDPGSGSAVERLFEQADEVNYLTAASRERLKKNSVRARDSATTCESRGTSEPA